MLAPPWCWLASVCHNYSIIQSFPRLAGYLGRFGPAEFKAAVEDSAWIDHVGAFSRGTDSKQARLQLAKVLAHLERERDHYKGGLGKCVIILTQDGQLRAAQQHGARKVHALPEADIAFPVEELIPSNTTWSIPHLGGN